MQSVLNKVLPKITDYLLEYLEVVLPSLYDDWWEESVIHCLSYHQQRVVLQTENKSLQSLDLDALLTIIEHNWHKITHKKGLVLEDRYFLKEMQIIQNHWSQNSSDDLTLDVDVQIKDLDTMYHFISAIDGKEELMEEINDLKSSLLAQDKESSNQDTSHEVFERGQVVYFKSDPSKKGVITSILPGKTENRYEVFVDGEIHLFFSSQLKTEESKDHEETLLLSFEEFHAYLTALQIQYPNLSTLYSLNAARIDFIPYQFRPVIKFIRSDRPRLLIADSVGVGKTIEAGLILRELQARRDIRSILIICPRPLVTERKWESEMKRFEERFLHLDGKKLRYCLREMDLEGDWPQEYQRAIVPYVLFNEAMLYGDEKKEKIRKGLLDLDPPPRFDLVIVDEAHHIRNQSTYSHKAVRFFCDHAESVIFLTATPIQLGSHDLFVLLNTLRPDLIIDQESFEHMAAPNPYINQAVSYVRAEEEGWNTRVAEVLEEAVNTSWGQSILQYNPEFKRVHKRMNSKTKITLEERVQLITDLENLHTFSGIISRTRRRDIGDFTIRKPETVKVEATPIQMEIHDELLQIQYEIFSRLHGDQNVMFMMTTIRRQVASCLFGLAPLLEGILYRHIDSLIWGEIDSTESAPSNDTFNTIKTRIESILQKVNNLDPYDPKLEALREIIRRKQSFSNNKIMLFSSFRHTLYYLYDQLKIDGFRVGLMHGGTPDDERIKIRKRFEMKREQNNALDILLFSEIGGEGLDYQFCDCIVNYDLPWNPMKIEQRIGRIDRNGQLSESVSIFNLITPGTVDADIYERCLVRIGVFENALGGSEEILGEINQEIRTVAEDFKLSAEERNRKLQQIADNKIRLIQEQEELEQRQLELFGIRFPENQIKKEIDEASSFWLSPEAICRLINFYLQQFYRKDQEFMLGEKALKTLRISQDKRNKLLIDFQKIPRKNSSIYRDWEKWLKGGDPHLQVTFEADCATKHPEAAFLMPLHPLVKQASYVFNTMKEGRRVISVLKAKSTKVKEGSYAFVMYQWRFHGIREDLILKPIGSDKEITPHLTSLLENAEEINTDEETTIDKQVWDSIEDQHYLLWRESSIEHRRRTKELSEFRRESLFTSHQARISLLNEHLRQATDTKIRKMRQSQIEAAESDYARHIQDLTTAVGRADITANPVAFGIINIYGGYP